MVEVNKSLCLDLEDGFWFGETIVDEIKTESGYGGYRFKILSKIGTTPTSLELSKLKRIHLDISIGVNLENIAEDLSLRIQ